MAHRQRMSRILEAPMRGDIDPEKEAEALREWQTLGHGEREAWFRQYLPYLGISRATWYERLQYLERNRPRKTRKTKGVRKIEDLEHHVKWIMAVKYNLPPGWRTMTTADAHLYCLQNDLIPPEAAALREGTINRVAREMGLYPMPEREPRFQGLYPGHLHQFDASTSEHFYPVRQEGGEWILKLRRRRMKNRDHYEHKKVLIYGLVDDFSRVRLSRYVVATGESAAGGTEFLRWAWCKSPEHEPICGIPEILYMDQGSLAKYKPFQDFCRDIPVELKAHRPYRSQATGKVEVRWKETWKRFETIFGVSRDWQDREISLSDLNQSLFAFLARMNQKRHPFMEMKCLDVWLSGVREMGGVVEIDPKAFDSVGKRHSRDLDGAGCFDFNGKVWQVKELYACKVWVYQLLVDGGSLLVKDPTDGKSYRPVPFAPQAVGEYRGQPKTELQKLREDPEYQLPHVTRFDFGADRENVYYLPPRTKEVRESGFEMPPPHPAPLPPGEREKSLAEVAQGVRVLKQGPGDGGQGSGARGQGVEEIYLTPADRYFALRVREIKGERLSQEQAEFVRQFQEESLEYRLLKDSLESRARIAAVD